MPDRFELEFDAGDQREHTCACCDARSHTVWGFVYEHGEAAAVYLVYASEGHPHAWMSVAWGGWGPRAGREQKRCVYLEVGPGRTEPTLSSNIPGVRHDADALGIELSPALAEHLRPQWAAVAEYVRARDLRVQRVLGTLAP
ncbi:MAG: hypothetical protein EP330_14060 [Deltaproteobacteria bacterium]|nr:MAG: hypothetical protein EP330_14060 [Deltaproteobacteria bacterium]